MSKKDKNVKAQAGHNVRDELAQKFLNLVPGLRPHLLKVFRQIERFDGRNAATIVSRMEATAAGYKPKLTGLDAAVVEEILQLLRHPDLGPEIRAELRDVIRFLKREAFQDERASLLLKLIRGADARVPFISMLFLRDHIHPIETLRPQCEPSDLIMEAESGTGESRARAVIRAYRETAEWLYYPYLRTLWTLTLLAKDERQPEPRTDGQRVIQLAQKLKDYPGLVDEDAGWRRNAAAHGHWEYQRNDDSIIMWDERHPRSTISVDELYAKLLAMYRIAGPTIARVGQLYLMRNVFIDTGLVDAFIDNIPRFLSTDEAERKAAELEVTEKANKVFGPLQSFLATCDQPAASA
jgi:hypothetical protein